MISVVYLLLFFSGLCVGSFLNVVIYRLNHGLSPLGGRSLCPRCKKKIAWRDNIPLLSFFLLKGRCRSCRSPISWQYPLVELATGVLTLFVIYYSLFVIHLSLLTTIYYLLVTYALMVIFVSDLRYTTIPDQVVYSAIGLALVWSLGNREWLSLLAGGVAAAGFFLFLVFVTRGKGMGMGDVKLAGLMGLVLGLPGIVVALMLAFLTGAVTGVILVLIGRKRLGEHIPFGPFLAGATWFNLFWGKIFWRECLGKMLGF